MKWENQAVINDWLAINWAGALAVVAPTMSDKSNMKKHYNRTVKSIIRTVMDFILVKYSLSVEL